MARPLRIEYPGAIYHVTNRGNARSDIYLDDDDRGVFLEVLSGIISRFDWLCHAYCLMSNHYHLIIETPQGNLSQGMRQLNGVYTQRFNRRHQRVGHLFQGRYKAIVVERDSHLLELSRYVVLNPVRAKMVEDANAWPWSSYKATAGIESCPSWLSREWLLSQFGGAKQESTRAYIQFVNDGNGRSIWDELSRQVYLGSEAFVEQMLAAHGGREGFDEVPGVQWKVPEKSLSAYARDYESKHEGMARAYLEGGYRMNEIAKCFGVHYATVSRAVKKMEGNV